MLRRPHRWLVWVALSTTGFSALGLQVVWQRTVSLHAGADTVATAIVVSGFLAGLGIGNVIGGRVADRLTRPAALRAVAVAELGVAAFAMVSTWALHDLFVEVAPGLSGSSSGRATAFLVLLVPTTLMGMSLPLVARAATGTLDGVGGEVGRLYAVNTLGGAVGALVVGWRLIGELGIVATARWRGALSLLGSVILVSVARRVDDPEGAVGARVDPADVPKVGNGVGNGSVVPWYAAYAVSGALALGLQQTFFRLVAATGRSNSYSFATVLALFLVTFAVGAALGARRVDAAAAPGRVFLWLQFGVGVASLTSLAVLTRVLPRVGLEDRITEWFNGDGFAAGYDSVDGGSVLLFAVLLPMLVICPSVLLMGASFPFVEQVVVDRLAGVGRRTGGLLAANALGNVVGVLVTAFVLFDAAGTAGTIKLLAGVLLVAGVVASVRSSRSWRPLGLALVLAAGGLLVLTPGNQRLWEFFSGDTGDGAVYVAEDAACASVVETQGEGRFQLSIDGATQNGYPYDDFHVLIGLVPSLVADDRPRSLAVGFGIGSSSYAMLADRDGRAVTTVELCGGHYAVADRLAAEGHAEFLVLRDDDRHDRVVGDGRHHLLRSDGTYDAVVVDTLRVTSSFSGQHYSGQFYELVSGALTDDGVFAQWVPTWRAQNSAAQVFPHLLTVSVPEYNDSVFMLGSRSPIDITAAELEERFERRAEAAFSPEQSARLHTFLAAWKPTCVTSGTTATGVPSEFENTDLMPRDEFHRNNGFIGETQTYGSCGV